MELDDDGSLDRDAFADLVMAGIRQAGESRPITYLSSWPNVIQQGSAIYALSGDGKITLSTSNQNGQAFRQIGHSNWTILLACVGGFLAKVFSGRRSRRVEVVARSQRGH